MGAADVPSGSASVLELVLVLLVELLVESTCTAVEVLEDVDEVVVVEVTKCL